MSKTIKTISIDEDIWVKVKEKTDSVSGTINFLLTRWVENEAEDYEKNKITKFKLELEKKNAEMAIMQKKMEEMKKEAERHRIVRSV